MSRPQCGAATAWRRDRDHLSRRSRAASYTWAPIKGPGPGSKLRHRRSSWSDLRTEL
jgi:hypothetical protein